MTIAQHYGRSGLTDQIYAALAQSGKDPDFLQPADLTGVDQFHIGGIESTRELAGRLGLREKMYVLDIGCGLGGPARHFAAEHGCQVMGVDVTPEFVETAGALTRRVGLDRLVDFREAGAAALPFQDETFDAATMIHVGMNLPDKAAAFREVRRVLRWGSNFGVFDIMRAGEGDLQYPVPWAETEELSFVEAPYGYACVLQEAGFSITSVRRQREIAIWQAEQALARIEESPEGGPGLQLLMGDRTAAMVGNILAMMRDGIVEPVEIIVRAV
jgi:ubiquinone/menaquinone biosynthesis C-methylase UbiE